MGTMQPQPAKSEIWVIVRRFRCRIVGRAAARASSARQQAKPIPELDDDLKKAGMRIDPTMGELEPIHECTEGD